MVCTLRSSEFGHHDTQVVFIFAAKFNTHSCLFWVLLQVDYIISMIRIPLPFRQHATASRDSTAAEPLTF